MRELRSGVRRGRAQQQQQNQPPVAVDGKRVVANTRRRRTAKDAGKKQEPPTPAANENIAVRNCGPTRSLEAKEEAKILEGGADFGGALIGEEQKKMDDYDSGGGAKSADKIPAAEEEGSTAPLPEKVWVFVISAFYSHIWF